VSPRPACLKVNAVDDEKRSDKEDSVPVPEVLKVAELAEYLRVHPATVYRLLRTKQLPAFRAGAEWRFSLDEIDRWCGEEERTSRSSRGRRKTPR
jgi:excisionase family DNA binding protein